MKFTATSIILFALSFAACNSSDRAANKSSDSDLDAARNFLDAALKGDYKNAASYMIQDSTNLEYLNMAERLYKGKSMNERDSLRGASLRFYDTKQVSDSVTITIFSNSFKNKRDTLKVLKINSKWLVDLKYLFEHDMDSATFKLRPKIDTIHK